MKVIVIGATGTIGRAIVKRLSDDHEIVSVGHTSGDYRVDIAAPESIRVLFEKTGPFDGLISAAGIAKFGNLDELKYEDFHISVANKLMGQINLVRIGKDYITEGGSFTLTSGILAQNPMQGSAAISTVNAGVEGFTRAAALELKNGVRINAVSPPWVKETMKKMGMDSSAGTAAEDVSRAYRYALESNQNGSVIDVKQFI